MSLRRSNKVDITEQKARLIIEMLAKQVNIPDFKNDLEGIGDHLRNGTDLREIREMVLETERELDVLKSDLGQLEHAISLTLEDCVAEEPEPVAEVIE